MNAPFYRDTVRLCLLTMLGCILFSCSHESAEELYPPQAKVITELQSEIITLINQHRSDQGLKTLNALEIAYPKAEDHTAYMINTGKVSHDNFYDREAYLVSEAGALQVAENVAYAYSTAEGVVNAWLKSSSHKAIIEGDYTHGSICAMKDAEGNYFYTHIFVKK